MNIYFDNNKTVLTLFKCKLNATKKLDYIFGVFNTNNFKSEFTEHYYIDL